MLENSDHTFLIVTIVGALIGLGKVLIAKGKPDYKTLIGRALVTGGIALSAFSVLAWIPEAPMLLIVGVSALLASLGTDGVTALLNKFINSKLGSKPNGKN